MSDLWSEKNVDRSTDQKWTRIAADAVLYSSVVVVVSCVVANGHYGTGDLQPSKDDGGRTLSKSSGTSKDPSHRSGGSSR